MTLFIISEPVSFPLHTFDIFLCSIYKYTSYLLKLHCILWQAELLVSVLNCPLIVFRPAPFLWPHGE